MNRTITLLLLAAAALAACTPDFDPASRIEKLRVLAIKAEPPEIDPAGVQTAALTSLVLRADFAQDPSRTTTVVHLACLPVPGDPSPSPCVQLAGLRDPTAFLAEAAPAACAAPGTAPIAFAGTETCVGGDCGPATLAGGATLKRPEVSVPAAWAGPEGVFAALPPTAPELVLGAQAIVLAFALDATPDELAAGGGGPCVAADLVSGLAGLWATREHVLSTKRVQIRGPDAYDPPNQNPAEPGIRAGTTSLDPDAVTTLAPGEISLAPVPGGEPELYTKLDAAGLPLEGEAREEWVYSWFSTAGELDATHTRGTEADAWTVGATAAGTPARVVAVVRDLRGGTAWAVRDVAVAP
ncbi:MAG TPA: hypothetical protein VF894_14975 [Anaeromyxobacter sp.]